MASYGHYGQRAARIGLDRIYHIRHPASVSVPFFQRMCKTDLDPIWMSWSGFGQTHLVWKLAGVQESSGPVSGRTQPARYQFPIFRLCSVLPQTSRIILCKTSADPIEFWLTVSGLGQTDPVRKQAGVQESSGPLLANASQPDWMRIGSGMFTGNTIRQLVRHTILSHHCSGIARPGIPSTSLAHGSLTTLLYVHITEVAC